MDWQLIYRAVVHWQARQYHVQYRRWIALSQISQAPPPISHSDHCHLSFNSNHLHLINTQLSQHYLSTHLTSVSCPISLTRSGLTPTLRTVTYLKIAYLLSLFLVGPPCLLHLPVFVRHPSSSSVLVRGVCSTTSSTSSWQENHHQYIFNILSTSRYLLTILPCLPDCWIQINIAVLFHILCVGSTSRNTHSIMNAISHSLSMNYGSV